MKRSLLFAVLLILAMLSVASKTSMDETVDMKAQSAYAAVMQGGLWGFINNSGTIVIEPQYKAVRDFSAGVAWVKKPNSKWGLIDESGKVLLNAAYDSVCPFDGGVSRVKTGGKWGLIDKFGVFICKPLFDEIFPFSDGLAIVKADGMSGFINRLGKIVHEPHYRNARSFNEGYASVMSDDGWRFICRDFQLHSEHVYEATGDFSEGLAAVLSNDKWGYINTKGEVVVPPRYVFAKAFSEEAAEVLLDKKWGFINTEGKYIIEPVFDFTEEFTNGFGKGGFVFAEKGDKWRKQRWFFVNGEGKVLGGFSNWCDWNDNLIPCGYRQVYEFEDGIALVQAYNENEWRLIDSTGLTIRKHGWPFRFSEGLCCFNDISCGSYRYIGIDGNYAFEAGFHNAYPFRGGRAIYFSEGLKKCGFIDTAGKPITWQIFDEARDFHKIR